MLKQKDYRGMLRSQQICCSWILSKEEPLIINGFCFKIVSLASQHKIWKQFSQGAQLAENNHMVPPSILPSTPNKHHHIDSLFCLTGTNNGTEISISTQATCVCQHVYKDE